ncbi:MAG: CBS domain-containing protein [Deltaproteobacteria bacterium]|nr:CBS domain-containing protein [Deltaproteobacteria bacterium]MBW2668177.1 CBS domain-containing protein [Deltaproteobacteria bacterium]
MTLTAPISTIMTRSVHTLDVSSKLSEARRALITNEFHHMPIVDGERLVGMISWRDLVRAYRAARNADASDPFGIDDVLDRSSRIDAAMTRELVTVRDDDSIDRAIDLIADAHIHSVLVLDSEERLVGIVTDKDIVDYLSS